MMLPSWVENHARTKMDADEQIVDVQVLKEGLFAKLALVQTNERRLVVSRGLFAGEVYPVLSEDDRSSSGTAATTEAVRQNASDEPVATEAPVEPDDLTQLDGVGKVRAERFNEAGIATFDQLVAGDAATLASELGVSVEKVTAWQTAARKL